MGAGLSRRVGRASVLHHFEQQPATPKMVFPDLGGFSKRSLLSLRRIERGQFAFAPRVSRHTGTFLYAASSEPHLDHRLRRDGLADRCSRISSFPNERRGGCESRSLRCRRTKTDFESPLALAAP